MCSINETDQICCPGFNPEPWEGKTHVWEKKLFVKDSIPTFFYIPFPSKINKMMTRMWNKIQEAGAKPEGEEYVILTKDHSPWRSEYYFAVKQQVPDVENTMLSGTFITKTFDGPYRNVPTFIKQATKAVEAEGKKVKGVSVFYTTCPECAKKYGHNYMVVFTEVEA